MKIPSKNAVKTIFCLIRHGATDWGKNGVEFKGTADFPLNSEGIKQTRSLARRLKKHKWELILSSDLQRARETAAILSEELQIPIILQSSLRERNHGILTTKSVHPRTDKINFLSKASGREPLGKFIKRVQTFGSLLYKHRQNNILVISHGGFLRTFAAVLLRRQKHKWGNNEIYMAPYEAIVSQLKQFPAPKTPLQETPEH